MMAAASAMSASSTRRIRQAQERCGAAGVSCALRKVNVGPWPGRVVSSKPACRSSSRARGWSSAWRTHTAGCSCAFTGSV